MSGVTLPPYSLAFIHLPSPPSPLLSESLPPSVSGWHVGSFPDHQPVSSDSLVWQRSTTKEAERQTYTAQGFLSALWLTRTTVMDVLKITFFCRESTWAASHHCSLYGNKSTLSVVCSRSNLWPDFTLNIFCNYVWYCAAAPVEGSSSWQT